MRNVHAAENRRIDDVLIDLMESLCALYPYRTRKIVYKFLSFVNLLIALKIIDRYLDGPSFLFPGRTLSTWLEFEL